MTLPIEPVLDRYEVDYNPDRGSNQQVKCFAHEDAHPSASVNLDRGLYNCYSCGLAGDGIELLMDQEGLDFASSVALAEKLAGEAGRQVSRESGRSNSLLPSRTGSKPGRRWQKPPWVGGRAR